jgi:hypothetical protein
LTGVKENEVAGRMRLLKRSWQTSRGGKSAFGEFLLQASMAMGDLQ